MKDTGSLLPGRVFQELLATRASRAPCALLWCLHGMFRATCLVVQCTASGYLNDPYGCIVWLMSNM